MAKEFAHLHNHTAHSPKDGLSRLDQMCEAAAADGQPAIAATDHGTLSGAWKLAKAADAAGIKPVIGQEIYLAIGSRRDQDSVEVARDELDADGDSSSEASGTKTKTYEHLTLLAQNKAGWSNLSEMTADAADHFWHKPRMDYELLAEHSEGIIALTGCISGPVAGALLRNDQQSAKQAVMDLRDIYGRDNLFVEVMDHGIPAEQRVTEQLFRLAKRAGLKVVATNDGHYTAAADADAHDMWLCIGSSNAKRTYKVTDTDRWSFSGTGYHLRSAAEMTEVFAGYDGGEAALAQSVVIADMVEASVLPESKLRLPAFEQLGEHACAPALLRSLVRGGAAARYGDNWQSARPDVKARIKREFAVIEKMGFCDYFLIVHDVVNWARSNGIRTGPGRGSAAGSVISYCLGIVAVDPIATSLLFERFLDETREEMPDIDLDFDTAGQARVFDYLTRRWGLDRVARLGTFGFSRAKQSLRNAARALLPDARSGRVGNELAKLVPGPHTTLTEMLDPTFGGGISLRDKLAADESPDSEYAQVVDAALTIEGVISSEGVHACGVVIATERLAPMVPLRRDRRAGHEGTWVTLWDGKDVADLGLLKLDILGLRNLDMITEALRQIQVTTGEVIDADNLSVDPADPRVQATWDMLGQGRTAGTFQLESAGMKRLCEQVRPESLEDLSAIVALYRPGPLSAGFHEMYGRRKHGQEEVDYGIFTDDPDEQRILQSVLANSLGLIIYQEQMMELGAKVAGFGPAENNRLRRAVSKKKRDEMTAVGKLFIEGAAREITDSNGDIIKQAFSPVTATRVWDGIKGAGDYTFNKSHSYAYGLLAYTTAYLKANWPAQYGAATLVHTKDDEKRLSTLSGLAADGIDVLPPSINHATVNTACGKDGKIRIGLSEIKGVGDAAKSIVDNWAKLGAYAGAADLISRVQVPTEDPDDHTSLTNTVVRALIEAGALDEFGCRKGQLMVLPALRLHPGLAPLDAEFSTIDLCARERWRLGVVLSRKPLQLVRKELQAWRTPIGQDEPKALHRLPAEDNAEALTIGILAALEEKTYSGGRMARITLEGTRGSLSGVAWDAVLSRIGRGGNSLPAVGSVVALRGRLTTVEVKPRNHDDGGDAEPVESVEPVYRREMRIAASTGCRSPTTPISPCRSRSPPPKSSPANRALNPSCRRAPNSAHQDRRHRPPRSLRRGCRSATAPGSSR